MTTKKVDIKFGTSGWRGIIADDFTFENVRIVAQAIAEYVKKSELKKHGVILGHDTRFMVEEFSAEIAKVLIGNGIKVLMCDSPVPTPVISYYIRDKKLAGGINLTASHNPAKYCGVKFNPESGGPALPEVTGFIEAKISEIQNGELGIKTGSLEKKGYYTIINPRDTYFSRLSEIIDMGKIKGTGIKASVDLLFGAGIDYLDQFLLNEYGENNSSKLKFYDDYRDPSFGGYRPEPDHKRMDTLGMKVKENGSDMGIALDGDADRFGIVDENGVFITPNEYLPMVAHHLYKNKNMSGNLVRSVATGNQMDKVAEKFGFKTEVTPVGFKYIGDKIINENALLGGEESGGLSMQGHVPEKDGLLACLFAMEMVAYEGKPLSEIKKSIDEEYGTFYNTRKDVELTSNEQKDKLMKKFGKISKEFAGLKIKENLNMDGLGFVFDMGENTAWLLARASGTEPVVRIYLESDKEETFDKLLKEIEKLL